MARVVMSGFGCLLLLGMGLRPAYVFELDGYLRASERCPPRTVTESSYDPRCVRDLLAQGPLYLGKEFLAASFALGAITHVSLSRVDRRFVTAFVAVVFSLVGFVVGAPLALWTARGSGVVQTLLFVALACSLTIAVLARWRTRPAVILLAGLYLIAWLGLLAWNAAEAHRHLSNWGGVVS